MSTSRTLKAPAYARLAALSLALGAPLAAWAQTGVDDDRVNLPEGPGSLEGVGENVDVNPNMGLMSYAIPIATPDGFPGVSPDLALRYSSGAGTGIVGIGWSFGTPSIDRMVSKGVPRYTADDRFADAGGDELVRITAGDGPQTYRQRYEGDFVRYTWTDAGPHGWWKAEYADGTIGYFGADRDGQIVSTSRAGDLAQGTARYHLVDLVDRYGNRLTYRYDSFEGNVPLPVALEYVHVDDEPRYVVRLAYEERPDLISDAGTGYEELWRYRLSQVRVFTGAELVREYVLDYQDDAVSGGASRLRTVRVFGVGGAQAGEALAAQFGFDYSRALGVDCEGNEAVCERPYVVDMGVLPGGVNLAAGRATLIDINGDGLPDVLDTTGDDAHRFFLNELRPAGDAFTHGFADAVESRVADGATFQLGSRGVQEMDLNGDGYADLVNLGTGGYLLNDGRGTDWASAGEGLDAQALAAFSGEGFPQFRFTDYDNDKRIDVIKSTAGQTQIFENDGEGFTEREIDTIGVGFDSGNLQLADMNGDGLNDPVELLEAGGVRYRLNLGRGRWTEWRNIAGIDIDPSEQDFVDLEDLNGDGLSDLVIVSPTQIQYAINRNASRFDALRVVAGDEVEGELPERADGVAVLYADMNANGSEDVVWFDPNGRVRYLELFPVRPHLISRIENGLGMVQKIDYGTSVEHAARARAAMSPWDVNLPYSMLVVDQTDTFATLTGADDGTGVHEVVQYTYRNGYYDGEEKQFRGFTNVETRLLGDETQEQGLTQLVYDNGIEDDARNGLMLSRTVWSDRNELSATTYTYGDCPMADVPTPVEMANRGLPPIRHLCLRAEETVRKEGRPEADWVTIRAEKTYDGYGQVSLDADLGVVARGGVPCGGECEGDEQFVETTWITPAESGVWILGLPARRSAYTREGAAFRTDERFYYDGDPFVGLPEGEATHGFLTRRTERVSPDGDAVVARERHGRTPQGQIAESLDPNGDPGEADTHRRTYSYDAAGLLRTGTSVKLVDPEGAPYELRVTRRYDDRFQNVSEASREIVYRNGQAASPVNVTRYRYDALGYLAEERRMGDADGMPSVRLTYELGDPASRMTLRRRTAAGEEKVLFRCFDGRGRTFQERAQLAPNRFQVSGFDVFNKRGEVVRSYQPYVSDSGACDVAEPEGVAFTAYRYDAVGRVRERTEPDLELHGSASIARTEYGPLSTTRWDGEDNDPASAHADTPTVEIRDGLGRMISLERRLGEVTATWNLAYDNLGNLATVSDPEGQVHRQSFDLLGRPVRVESPHHGAVVLEYDAAGNIVSRADERRVVERREYDGLNRMVAVWDAADAPNTTIRWRYDFDPACPAEECTNTAGEGVSVTYPVGVAGLDGGADRYGYDARGRRVFAARRLGGIDLPNRATFDDDDRATAIEYPDGGRTEVAYDGLDRRIRVSPFVDSVARDARGLVEQVRFANGVLESRAYDVVQRLSVLAIDDAAGTPIVRQVLTRDREGHVTGIGDSSAGSRRALGAEDDDWYRPTTVTYGDGEVLTLGFGSLDELLLRTSSLGPDSASHVGASGYDPAHRTRVQTAGELGYVHDDAGYVTRRGEQTLTWDHRGLLTGTRAGNAVFEAAYGPDRKPVATLDDGWLTLYGHDDFEVRDGIAVTYGRLEGDRVGRRADVAFAAEVFPDVAPTDAGGVAAPDGVISAADAWTAWARAEGVLPGGAAADVDRLLAASARRVLVENGDATTILHGDHLGSLVAATDEGGDLRGQRDFFPYGTVRWEAGYVDAYGYTGQQHFAATGLIHFHHRPLDPWAGRFLSADPAFDVLRPEAAADPSDAFTGYAYAHNDPLATVDPTGLKGGQKGKVGKKGKKKKGEEGPTERSFFSQETGRFEKVSHFQKTGEDWMNPGGPRVPRERTDSQGGDTFGRQRQGGTDLNSVGAEWQQDQARRHEDRNVYGGNPLFPHSPGKKIGVTIGAIVGALAVITGGVIGGVFAYGQDRPPSNDNNPF